MVATITIEKPMTPTAEAALDHLLPLCERFTYTSLDDGPYDTHHTRWTLREMTPGQLATTYGYLCLLEYFEIAPDRIRDRALYTLQRMIRHEIDSRPESGGLHQVRRLVHEYFSSGTR
ncbi:hypothetical protein [Embleya sp. NBC_00896]|uniref:hypothetical protein n=1 Tax=Embleya sp. NBC_00896 TaxID=2975961 RepID=UPI002F910DAD|nr:hypothetical protein OG928_48545 [Embleya sp. NBC_00896]